MGLLPPDTSLDVMPTHAVLKIADHPVCFHALVYPRLFASFICLPQCRGALAKRGMMI